MGSISFNLLSALLTHPHINIVLFPWNRFNSSYNSVWVSSQLICCNLFNTNRRQIFKFFVRNMVDGEKKKCNEFEFQFRDLESFFGFRSDLFIKLKKNPFKGITCYHGNFEFSHCTISLFWKEKLKIVWIF